MEAADIAVAYPTLQHIYGAMRGINAVGNKANMALLLRQHLAAPVVHALTPPTYILSEMEDLRRLDAVKAGQGLFYFKSYVHAQHMVRITDDPAAVLLEQGTPYIVSQQILGQPLTVHDTKVTLRAYLLLIARQGSFSAYVAKDGPVYYADEPYDETSASSEVVVANKYPLAPGFPPYISGLMDVLGEERWEELWENILRALGTTMHALQGFLERQNADVIAPHASSSPSQGSSGAGAGGGPSHSSSGSSSSTRSIILGVDLLPLQNLTVKLLEINAAPHLGILYDCKDPARKQASVQFAADLLCGGLHLARALHCPSGRRLWMPLTTGLLLNEGSPAAAGREEAPGSSSSSSTSSASQEGRSASGHSSGSNISSSSSSSSSEEAQAGDSIQQQQPLQHHRQQQRTVLMAPAADGEGAPASEDR
jgi:hypothetical protein